MAGKRDVVWVADKIIALLKASLPAKLNVLDAEYNDGIVLEDVQNDSYHVAPQLEPMNFPVVTVLYSNTDVHPFDGQSKYNLEHHMLDICVALISRGESEDELMRRTSRTLRAIEEVILGDRSALGMLNDTLIISKSCDRMFADENNGLFQEAQITVRAETQTTT